MNKRMTNHGTCAVRRRTGGFTILELLISLGLLTIFAFVAGLLTYQSIRVLRQTPATERTAMTDARVLEQLRKDVWGASAVSCVADRVTLQEAEGGEIQWRITATGTLVRTQAGVADVSSPGVAAGARFEVSSGGIVLSSPEFRFYAMAELLRISGGSPATRATTRKGGK